MTIPDQIRRRGERALHKAALAIIRGDMDAKAKHLDEAKYWERLLKAAGEDMEGVRG